MSAVMWLTLALIALVVLIALLSYFKIIIWKFKKDESTTEPYHNIHRAY